MSRCSDDQARAQQIEDILLQSRRRNHLCEITGGLMYTDGFFFQVLEGPGPATAALMQSITADARHSQVTPLLFESTRHRQFSDWSMGYADIPGAAALIEPLFRTPDGGHADQAVTVLLQALQEGARLSLNA